MRFVKKSVYARMSFFVSLQKIFYDVWGQNLTFSLSWTARGIVDSRCMNMMTPGWWPWWQVFQMTLDKLWHSWFYPKLSIYIADWVIHLEQVQSYNRINITIDICVRSWVTAWIWKATGDMQRSIYVKTKTKQNKTNNTDANKWRDINKIFNLNKNIQ